MRLVYRVIDSNNRDFELFGVGEGLVGLYQIDIVPDKINLVVDGVSKSVLNIMHGKLGLNLF
jgi:hypothetical protein